MTTIQQPRTALPAVRAGVTVRVRSKEEILATLDADGRLDGQPFMPEMLEFAGRELPISAVAHKTCDTISSPSSGLRQLDHTVHLAQARCDGSAHGGCEAACLTFWKTAWLRKVGDGEPPAPTAVREDARLLPLITLNARGPRFDDGAERYRCQATELLHLPLSSTIVEGLTVEQIEGWGAKGNVRMLLGVLN